MQFSKERSASCNRSRTIEPRGGPGVAPERMPQHLAETAVSNSRLSAEILDHTAENLHDTKDTLGNCCLVSESQVPRTRKHPFTDIGLNSASRIELWKTAYVNCIISPAAFLMDGSQWVARSSRDFMRRYCTYPASTVFTAVSTRSSCPDIVWGKSGRRKLSI